MKISKKLTILLIVILSLISAALIIYDNYIDNNLMILFDKERNDKRANFEKLIQLKRQSIISPIENFTYWDDLVNFITTDQDETWSAENIDTALDDFNVNSIWIYNINTNLVYSVNNLEAKTLKTIPIPKESINKLFIESHFCYFHIPIQEGIMEISGATIHPTADSERKTPPSGYFLVGRLLDKAYIDELAKLVRGEASMASASDEADQSDKEIQKEGIIRFSKALMDWNNVPLANINVQINSDSIHNLSDAFDKVIQSYIIFSLLIAFVIIYYFITWISTPLRSISRTLRTENVNSIDKLKKHKNEFGDVARLIFIFFSQKEELTKEIADRKRAEEELRESNHNLEETLNKLKTTQQRVALQQERLGVLGQLTSGIAHDFNNALTPILGYSDMMLDNPKTLDDIEKVEKYLKFINIAAKDAREIVNRLREFYRNREESEIFTPVDFNELILQTIQLTRPKWKDQAQAKSVNINIATELQEIPPVNGDEAGLRDALTNLIFNSTDAITTEGTISLHTRTDDKYVVFEISDTGIGMSEETRKRCFEAFFTTKGENGTGLGLSMVYGIIQRHNGTIDIKSMLGKGTTFIIQLPISTKEQNYIEIEAAEETIRPIHALVVDDEPLVRNIIGEFLSVDGHTFELASNGDEGLGKFESGNFDLVITDRAMPDISGDQLAQIIKKIAANIPIIMITGFGNIMKASNELPENVDFLLSKPITLSEFQKVLKDAIDLRQI